MTEIRFYHLQNQSEGQVLPSLLSIAYERGHRIVVKCKDEQTVNALNDHLWTFRPDSFLPHGAKKNGRAAQQPIWITAEDENPNEADVLILCDGVTSEAQGEYTLCCEMLDGHNEASVTAARTRWKSYKDKGYDVTYWQQGASGGWEKKA